MAAYHPDGSYYVPAHLERAGPFNPDGNNGFNIEHLRNFNNAGPNVAFGFETQPGHGASTNAVNTTPRRNTISGVSVDSVGGTTFGGTGVYAAQIGGVWDALLGEGRNWWFFASSDWHNRGAFGVDDRRSDNDFWPGEYQRNYTMVRNGGRKLTPQTIVDGLRTGNNWVASGQLIDRLAFVACARPSARASRRGPGHRGRAQQHRLRCQGLRLDGREAGGAAGLGCGRVDRRARPRGQELLALQLPEPVAGAGGHHAAAGRAGARPRRRDPRHGHRLRAPGSADYAGAWPDNWVDLANPQQLKPLSLVPAAAKNTTASVLQAPSTAAPGRRARRASANTSA